MRWPARPPAARREWRRVLALWPRRVGDVVVWLEPIERRLVRWIYTGGELGFQPVFEYRFPEASCGR